MPTAQVMLVALGAGMLLFYAGLQSGFSMAACPTGVVSTHAYNDGDVISKLSEIHEDIKTQRSELSKLRVNPGPTSNGAVVSQQMAPPPPPPPPPPPANTGGTSATDLKLGFAKGDPIQCTSVTLRNSRPADGMVLDAGARRGSFTSIALKGNFKTISYEGDKRNCKDLNSKFGGKSQWTLHCAAIADWDGPGEFWIRMPLPGTPQNYQSHGHLERVDGTFHWRTNVKKGEWKKEPVPVVSADATVPDGNVLLFKIDIQGGEDNLLNGAKKLFSAGRVKVAIMEISTNNATPDVHKASQRMCDLMAQHPGYRCYIYGMQGDFPGQASTTCSGAIAVLRKKNKGKGGFSDLFCIHDTLNKSVAAKLTAQATY